MANSLTIQYKRWNGKKRAKQLLTAVQFKLKQQGFVVNRLNVVWRPLQEPDFLFAAKTEAKFEASKLWQMIRSGLQTGCRDEVIVFEIIVKNHIELRQSSENLLQE